MKQESRINGIIKILGGITIVSYFIYKSMFGKSELYVVNDFSTPRRIGSSIGAMFDILMMINYSLYFIVSGTRQYKFFTSKV